MEIAIIDTGYKSYSFEKDLFERNGIVLKIFPGYQGDPAEKKDFARNAGGILVRHTVIGESFLDGMTNLKAIVRYGVGYDNIDIDACSSRGIRVANVQGYANHAVSDHALALMLSCTRGMWNTADQMTRKFSAPPAPDIFELHDKILGIIGIGRIGSEFCRKASPLFREVIASDPYKPAGHFEKLSVKKVPLDVLLNISDVISIHCNLTPETKHFISRDKLTSMTKRPVLINTSRGEVLNERDLLDALNAGTIHSAGLDVFENEPVTERQKDLINHPRVICTGHYAWYSDNSSVELQRRAALNLLGLIKGEKIEDCLNF